MPANSTDWSSSVHSVHETVEMYLSSSQLVIDTVSGTGWCGIVQSLWSTVAPP